jgi:hypothetical protein
MDEVAALKNQCGDVESEYCVAQEWGLFVEAFATAKKSASATSLETKLSEASSALKGATPDLEKARAALTEARGILAGEKNKNVVYWSGIHLGLIPIFLSVSATAAVYFLIFCDFRGLNNVTVRHDAAFWGMLGAVLRSFYWMQFQINRAMLRPRWLAFFVVGPLIGTLLGGVASVCIVAGAGLITGVKTFNPEWHAIALVAFYSGFQWQWALTKIETGAESVMNRLKSAK